jgi:glycosyltransferase involved in cell wall biosynthesis
VRSVTEAASLPMVSIPLCTFNGAAFLREQMDSLLKQTHTNIEIIAVDDCSTDGTLDLLNQYAVSDHRVRVLVNPRNLGFRENFARALAICQGEFIAPCDQDDWWAPDKLSIMLCNIGTADMVYCDSKLVDESGQSLERRMSDKWHMNAISDPARFAFENNISGHAMLFRQRILERALPIPQGFFHDWWLAAVAASVAGVVYCGKALVHYRQHQTNVTRRVNDKERRAGFGLQSSHELIQRTHELARLPGSHQLLLGRLEMYLSRREQQWLSPRLSWLLIGNHSLFFSLRRHAPLHRLTVFLKFLFGIRLKSLFRQRKYGSKLKGRPV